MSEVIECHTCGNEVEALNHLVVNGFIYCDKCYSFTLYLIEVIKDE